MSLPYGRTALSLPRVGLRLDAASDHSLPAPPPLDRETIAAAFDRPLGFDRIDDALDGARTVAIVVSDGTRETGAREFMPALLRRIGRRDRVTFAIGCGLHRPPTPAEVERILGAAGTAHPVVVHDAGDDAALVSMGRTTAGTAVAVHRALLDHDATILTGAIGFHYYAGFSGGRKAVVPGMAARATIFSNHLRALRRDGSRHPGARAGRLDGNPVHRDMAEGAALVRPRLLVNAVTGEAGGIERLFVGHWRRAHEAGCSYLRKTRTVGLVPRPLVVASAGGHPYDIDLVQAHKAYEAAFRLLQPGGVFVLVAACPDGLGHADFVEGLRLGGSRDVAAALRSEYRVYRQTALAWHEKTEACRLILVSGLPAEVVRSCGAEPAADLAAALRSAERSLGPGAAGWIVESGARRLYEAAGADGRKSV